MIVRVFFAALIAAVLGFAWGFIFWGVLGAGSMIMAPLPQEATVKEALVNAGLASGVYVYPFPAKMDDEEDVRRAQEQHMKGPIMQIAYRPDGGPPMPPEQYVKGVVHYFAVALIAGALLAMARSSLPRYGSRVLFVLLLGLLATVWAHWADAIWFADPWPYTAGRGLESLVTALIMGLVLAAIIKPTTTAGSAL
jgi:hypothetical protein